VLTDEERDTLSGGPAPEELTGAGAAVSDRIGCADEERTNGESLPS